MKLLSAARRVALAGFVTALSFGVAMDAWAQRQIAGCSPATGRARVDSLPGTIQRILENPNARPEDLAQARTDCQNMSSAQHVSVSGQMCVARINLIEARRSEDNRRASLDGARCAAHKVSWLARNNSTVRREANGYWAEALVGLMGMGAGDPATYQRELNSVHGGTAAPMVHRAIVDGLLNQNRIDLARNEINNHLRNMDRDRALAFISVARHQMRTGVNDAAVRQTLTEAYQADGRSLVVNSELGKAYFEQGRSSWSTAEPFLRTAVSIEPPPAGEENAQEQAYYYLSVIEADRGQLGRALEYADNAGNEARALRQVCLVRLMIGREQIARETWETRNGRRELIDMQPNPDAQRSCERLGSSAEGQLLEGMFWLRYSQFRGLAFAPVIGSRPDNYTPWRDAISTAERAFENGRRRLGDDTTTKLNWPGTDISMRSMLGYGDDLADYFLGFCRGSINSNDEERRAEDIFIGYKVVRVRGDPRRCLPPEAN